MANSAPMSFTIELFRFTHSYGWQKLSAKGIKAIPDPEVITLPEIKTRVWLKDKRTKAVIATMVRRDERIKITANNTTLVFVFQGAQQAVEFCEMATERSAVTEAIDTELQLSAERERGVDVLAYASTLLTDAHFCEFAQDLELALLSSEDGRALMESFVQNLSRRSPY